MRFYKETKRSASGADALEERFAKTLGPRLSTGAVKNTNLMLYFQKIVGRCY